MRACQRGDVDSWGLLVRRYERLVFSVALRNGLNAEDAADATQNTFAALVDSIDRLHDEERLPFWLMTVTRRQAWRVARRREREQALAEVPVEPGTPLDQWESDSTVHAALRRLDAPCRDLLLALYFDPSSPSYATVADRLGRAVGGLGPMRGRCLAKLRSLLGDDFRA